MGARISASSCLSTPRRIERLGTGGLMTTLT
jgi:hypothetical protein